MRITRFALVSALALASAATHTRATPVTYQFTTTVSSVNPGAADFPAALAGVQVGDPITGTLTYDAASPAVPNPFGGVYALATPYGLLGPSFSVTIGTTTLNSWSGSIDAFVWNDDVTTGPGTNDGVIYANVISPGQTQFKVGNLILPTSTFSDESLPSGDVPGLFLFTLGSNGGDFLSSAFNNLTTVTPEPSACLAVASLAVLPLRNRRRG